MRQSVLIRNLISTIILFVTIGIILCSKIEEANAYFTTYVTAKGGYKVNWSHKESIEESFMAWNKYISITSDEGSIPVYVRVKALAGSTYELLYSGADWEYCDEDGYYYYKKVLAGGSSTTSLCIYIDKIPVMADEGDNFNVVVVYETIPVQYDDMGNVISPMNAEWEDKNNG